MRRRCLSIMRLSIVTVRGDLLLGRFESLAIASGGCVALEGVPLKPLPPALKALWWHSHVPSR